ncbi:hypothetical protein KSD_57030 [Ktedonobacter sp. SOSP1-85]|nr:hypothetical protein KSD_57030 [Ktedonobacter sp. SOSP1-85]
MQERVFLREREACVEEEQMRGWLGVETWFPVRGRREERGKRDGMFGRRSPCFEMGTGGKAF